MNEGSKKSNIIQVSKDIGVGFMLFMGIVLLMVIIAIIGSIYYPSPSDTMVGIILVTLFMILLISSAVAIPILVLILLIIDIIKLVLRAFLGIITTLLKMGP